MSLTIELTDADELLEAFATADGSPPPTTTLATCGRRRPLIPSTDRVDNNFDCLLKVLGHKHKRNKSLPRDINSIRSLLADYLGKVCKFLDFENLDLRFTTAYHKVCAELESLNSKSINRAPYTEEFKASLRTLCLCSNESISPLTSAAESAGLFTKPNTKPVRSLEEAEEKIKSLECALLNPKNDERFQAAVKQEAAKEVAKQLAMLAPLTVDASFEDLPTDDEFDAFFRGHEGNIPAVNELWMTDDSYY